MERAPSMTEGDGDADDASAVLSPCVEVPMRRGEATRKKLSDGGVLRTDLAIVRDGQRLLLPVTDGPSAKRIVGISADAAAEGEADDCRLTEAWFQPVERPPSTYKDAIEGVPADIVPLLPTAFDMIGHVAIVKLRPEVEPYAMNIGEALLRANKSVRTVLRDGGVKGPFRVREVTHVAGDLSTIVTYKEHGITYRLDVSKVYFSPRLATERDRVAGSVRDGERVLDMFAGVGPFSILIAKRVPGCSVVAVEMNPDAFAYLKENVSLNGTSNVSPILGDAAEVADEMASRGDLVDRIIMNLPHDALLFVPHALGVLKDGGTVHFHEITEDAALTERRVTEAIAGKGRACRVTGRRMVRNYAPGITHEALDIIVGR